MTEKKTYLDNGTIVAIIIISAAFSSLSLSPYSVSAQQISSYDSTITVTDKTIYETRSFTVLNTHKTELTEFSYPVNGRIEDLAVTDSRGSLESSFEYKSGKTIVKSRFRRPISTGENYTITFKFSQPDRVSIKGDTYILSISHSLLANVKRFNLKITLPEGYGVAEEGISPEARISSDGRRVILIWELNEPIPVEFREFKVIVLYERLGILSTAFYYYAIIFVISLLLAFLIYRYYRSRKTGTSTKKDLSDKVEILKDDEQLIMKLIIDQDGIDQREIIKTTDFSKAKVSKILSELEKREIIFKKQIGRRNKLFLTKKVKET